MALVQLDETITLSLSVTDRKASAAWYAEKMGFEVLYDVDEIGWCEMSTNAKGVSLGLGEQAEAAPGNSVPVFGTPDIETSRRALEAAGVKFDGETMVIDGMVKLGTFYDPDNNALMLAQDLTRYP